MGMNMRNIRLLCVSILVLALGAVNSPRVEAQAVGQTGPVYVGASGGISFYSGDLSSVNSGKAALGLAVSLGEVGYAMTPSFSALVGVQAADYRRIGKPAFRYGKEYWEEGFLESRREIFTSTWRYTAYVAFEYMVGAANRVSPYVRLGAHVTQGGQMSGWAGVNQTALGPIAGLGTVVRLSDRVDILLGGQMSATFPDRAVDGFTDETISDNRSYDLLGAARAGLRIRLGSSFRAVEHVEIHGPVRLQSGEPGYFSAGHPGQPSTPLTYDWTLGDGTRLTGRTISHTYSYPDTFQVSLAVSNARSRDSVSMRVIVTPEPGDSVDTEPSAAAAEGSEDEDASTGDTPLSSVDSSACSEALETARSRYQNQRFSAARQSLSPCMKSQLPDDLRVESLRLVALSYLGAGNFEDARMTVLKLLGIDPDYTADPVYDPPNYTSLVAVVKRQLGYSDGD